MATVTKTAIRLTWADPKLCPAAEDKICADLLEILRAEKPHLAAIVNAAFEAETKLHAEPLADLLTLEDIVYIGLVFETVMRRHAPLTEVGYFGGLPA